jgi:arabinofuranosyltransferase
VAARRPGAGAADPAAPLREPAAPTRSAAQAGAPAGVQGVPPLAALLAGLAAWSGWFILRTTLGIGGRRYFCLFEDAMISMTYARNLVEGHGLNWARGGAPVEGFTHPLWMALMVPVNLLPVDLRFRSLAMQLLSLALLLLHVVLVRRLVLAYFSTARARHWMPAALLTACYYPLNYWALMGMESALQAVLTAASSLAALAMVCRGEDRGRTLWLLGAAACLLRMDMVLMVAVVQVWMIAGGGLRGGRRRAHWLQGAAVFAAVNAGYLLFRWLYFHDLLPNTYYLKLYRVPLGVRLLRGVKVLGDAAADHLLLLVAVGVGVAVVVRFGRDRDLARRLLLPAALLAAPAAYCVYVGGDAWEMDVNVRADRFVVYAVPQLFILFNALINLVSERMAQAAAVRAAAASEAAATAPSPPRRGFVAVATALALLVADGLWLSANGAENFNELMVGSPPMMVVAMFEVMEKLDKVKALIGPTGVLATGPAGVPAYFSDYRMVDLYGYNERRIAREAPALPLSLDNFETMMPGHIKFDWPYVVARYHPDAILVHFVIGGGDPAAVFEAAGYRYVPDGTIWLRGDRAVRLAGGRPVAPPAHTAPASGKR